MPPMGNHPVRAATKTRNSDVSSGGIESRISDADRIAAGSAPLRTLPVDDAERQADERGQARAATARIAVFAARSGTRSLTGRS